MLPVNDRKYVFHFRPKPKPKLEKHLALGRILKPKPKVHTGIPRLVRFFGPQQTALLEIPSLTRISLHVVLTNLVNTNFA